MLIRPPAGGGGGAEKRGEEQSSGKEGQRRNGRSIVWLSVAMFYFHVFSRITCACVDVPTMCAGAGLSVAMLDFHVYSKIA